MTGPTQLSVAAPIAAPEERAQLLLAMYKATWDNINRHILVVWQSVAALFTALAASYLSAATFISPDFVASLVIVTAGWAVAIALDASGWYNRNLHIIANIERQFLRPEDGRDIHFYFTKPPRRSKPIDFLQIQIVLGGTIACFALLQHFIKRVSPGLFNSWTLFDPLATLPYIVFVAVGIMLRRLSKKVIRNYEDLQQLSPGRAIGHGNPPAPSNGD